MLQWRQTLVFGKVNPDMLTQLAKAAAESEPTSWPDALIILGMFVLVGFMLWLFLR